MPRYARRVGSLVAVLLASGVAYAEDDAKLDAEFLEFLGSLDSDDEVWTEFLDAADLAKVTPATDETKAEPEPKKVKEHEP
jgi:hypothetical protein